MRGRLIIMASIVCVLQAIFPFEEARADKDTAKKIDEAIQVLEEVMAIPEKGVPETLLREAYGVAVIPSVIKVGLVVGGRRGRGLLVVRREDGWSRPSFVTITGGSIGWQLGAQSTDVILVFRNKRSIDGVVDGKFTLGADASVAAGPVGRHAEAGTDVKLKAEIYSYSRARGLFAGVSFEGAKLQIDNDANSHLYGKKIAPRNIFEDADIETPSAAQRFVELLTKYAMTDEKEAD